MTGEALRGRERLFSAIEGAPTGNLIQRRSQISHAPFLHKFALLRRPLRRVRGNVDRRKHWFQLRVFLGAKTGNRALYNIGNELRIARPVTISTPDVGEP